MVRCEIFSTVEACFAKREACFGKREVYHVLVLGVGPVVLPVVQRDGHLRVNRIHDHDRQRVEPLREERPEGGLLVLGAVVGPGNERAGQSASRGWLGWLFAARFTP